jgi:hypothetical protein
MRKRSPAKSALSSPPVPARISRKRFLSSLGSRGRSMRCSSSSRAAMRAPCGELLVGELAHRGSFAISSAAAQVALGLAVLGEGARTSG